MNSITFITTGQPTTNPRLVKEAQTLIALGYRVKVIYCFYQQWAQKFDTEIISKNPEVYNCCGGDPFSNKFLYLKTRIRQKICFLLYNRLPAGLAAEKAISRTHAEALSLAKKYKSDLYIAHNLGALPAAVLAAKHHNAKAGYDAEDMHSAEFIEKTSKLYLLNKYIEETYFPETDYFSAASPLIAGNYKTLYTYLEPVVVNNVFPIIMQPFNEQLATGKRLKLFWFSQTVGRGRGIEQIIAAIATLEVPAELHLLGNSSPESVRLFKNLAGSLGLDSELIFFHQPVSHENLIATARQFDIGMAAETGEPLNRDICLTNKLFVYIQCGLAVLASDTQAQIDFMGKYPGAGKLYKRNDPASLAECLKYYSENRAELYQAKMRNYELGQNTMNWERESGKFVKLVRSVLPQN